MSNYKPFKARLVMGSLFEINTRDHTGAQEPNESKHNWFMAFAVPKGPAWDEIYTTMYQEAVSDARCGKALADQPGFNWKIEDCDNPDDPTKKGTASRPAGHMLIKFTRYRNMGPLTVLDGNHNRIINDKAVKRGDYFYISGSTKFNGAATVKTNAGMYQNINAVMFAEAGEEIISEGSFDASKEFAGLVGGQVVNGGTSQAGAPVAAKPMTPPPAAPAPVTPPAAPSVTPPPAYDLVTPPPVVEERYEYSGITKTLTEWAAVPGWTEELIKQHGKRV